MECPMQDVVTGQYCSAPVQCTVGVETSFDEGKAYTDLDIRQHRAECGHVYMQADLWDALYAAVAQAVKDGED